MPQSSDLQQKLRALPAVQKLVDEPDLRDVLEAWGHDAVVDAARKVLNAARERIRAGEPLPTPPALVQATMDEVKASLDGGVQRVINATGVILHTGLGRALLADAALRDIASELRGYSNVELNMVTGERGERDVYVAGMIQRLLKCEAATVVNNNAAATLLVLKALAQGKEVIVSRGQLVEIGGAFRLPDVMALSGAKLVEVGCTNRTHLRDYERAITPDTGLLMLVHTSNYRVIGFTKEVEIEALAELGRKHNIPVFHDVGSGCLLPDLTPKLKGEPVVSESVAAGADVLAFSGDKIVGGPQSGIICGRKDLIQKIRKDPMWRAVRLDKLILRAMQSTLALYFDSEKRTETVPTLRLLCRTLPELDREAESLATQIKDACPALRVDTAAETSRMGSGSLPERDLPTRVVRLSNEKMSAATLADLMRKMNPPIIVRVHEDRVLIDPRTLLPGDTDELLGAIKSIR